MPTPTPKEIKSCSIPISIKEENGEFYSKGFIATTHPDRAYDPELGVDGDVLSKNVMTQISDYINKQVATIKGVGSTRTVSLQHDWVKESDPDLKPAGMAMPPAEVRQTDDGHFGVHVKTHHNKTHPKYDDIIYDVKHGYLPGYSIEYEPGEWDMINVNGNSFRFLKTIKNFVGYAFASARKIANPSAVITGYGYKEIEDKVKEVSNMAEEEIKKEVQEPVQEESETQSIEKEKIEDKIEDKSETVIEDKKEEVIEEKEINVKEIVEQLRNTEEYKEAIDSVKFQSKVIKTGIKEEDTMNIRIKEMNDSLQKGNILSAKESGLQFLRENEDFYVKAIQDPKHYSVGFKSNLNIKAIGKGLKIMGGLQIKGTLDSADNTSSYTQAPVEFADLFAPGIIDTFNNQTNLFGFLEKENHPGGTHYQWKIITNKDPDSNPTFVDFDDTSVLKNFSSKVNLQTPIKIARRGVSVADTTNRYSASSLGDLFQLELDLQSKELMNDVNEAIFAEVADGTNNHPLGLEAVADSAGNTTMYGLTRSTANRLSPDAAGDTYTAVAGAITEAAMRTKMSTMETAGVKLGRMAIIASPTTRDLLFNLLDGERRFGTTEAQFGFNKMMVPVYDGVPIVVDADCNTDALYFIDRDSDKIIIAMEPRIISLAKVGAATEAYVEMHFAHVYKEPRKIGMLDTLA